MHEQEDDFSFKKLFLPLTTLKAIHIIVFIGLIVFFMSLFNNFIGDDFQLIIHNPSIHSLTNIPSLFAQGNFYDPTENHERNNFYRPIVSITYALIYSISGEFPVGYHLAQLLLHIGNAILLFLIFKHFFKNELALCVALLFLIHPINTEAVAYISAIGENLFLFFGLLALYFIINKKPSRKNILLTLFFLLLSVLSKEAGFLFLFLALAYSYVFKHIKPKILFMQSAVILALYLFLRFIVAHIFINKLVVAPIQILPLAERLMNIPAIIFFYLKTFFYPQDLLMFQTWTIQSLTLQGFFLPLLLDILFVIILTLIGIYIHKKNKKTFAIFLFFTIWFVAGFSLYLQIIPLDQTVADHWFYFPSIGLLGIIGSLFSTINVKSPMKKAGILLILILFALFSIKSMARIADWKNEYSLYTHDIKTNTQSYQLEWGLGNILQRMGDNHTAEKRFLNATKLFPHYISYKSLGIFYLQTGNYNKAKEALVKSLEYSQDNTNALLALAITEYKLGNDFQAKQIAQKGYSLTQNKIFLNILKQIEEKTLYLENENDN